MNLVIDTNIFIAALLKDSKIRELIVNSHCNLLVPELIYQEIEEHKEELINKSGLSEEEFNNLISLLNKYLTIIPNEKLANYQKEAETIIGAIDKDDIPIMAASLSNNNCPIWSDDFHLQKQKTIKVFTTKEIIEKS